MDDRGFVFVVRSKGRKVVFRESNITRLVQKFPQSDVEVFDTCNCKPVGTMRADVIASKFC